MLIQLRRVVYLLVLLQCCVCVVNASGIAGHGQDGPGGNDDITQVEEKLGELERQSFVLSDSLPGAGTTLSAAVGLATRALSNATGIVEEANGLIGKTMTGGGSKTNELRETAQKVNESVATAEYEVGEMNRRYKEAVEKAKEGSDVTEELKSAIEKFSQLCNGSEGKCDDLDRYKGSLGHALLGLEGLRKSIKNNGAEKERMNTELSSLKKSLRQIEEDIQKLSHPQESQTRGHQRDGETNADATSGQRPPQDPISPPIPTENKEKKPQSGNTGVNTTTTGNGNVGEQQSDGKGVSNNQSATQDNVTPKEPKGNENTEKPENTIPNKQNETQSDKNEEQSAQGKPNNTGDSKRPTTPSNTASGTVNTGPGGVMSGSHSSSSSSSGTINFNVSGLSDGSSSPALVQSPLLILLLCVLGSILVC